MLAIIGGAATLPKVVGGSGFNAVQAHEILGPLVEPISAADSGSYCWSSSWWNRISANVYCEDMRYQKDTSLGREFNAYTKSNR